MKIYLDDLRPAPDGWTLVKTIQEVKDLLPTMRFPSSRNCR